MLCGKDVISTVVSAANEVEKSAYNSTANPDFSIRQWWTLTVG
jgi:hypothetical protein